MYLAIEIGGYMTKKITKDLTNIRVNEYLNRRPAKTDIGQKDSEAKDSFVIASNRSVVHDAKTNRGLLQGVFKCAAMRRNETLDNPRDAAMSFVDRFKNKSHTKEAGTELYALLSRNNKDFNEV